MKRLEHALLLVFIFVMSQSCTEHRYETILSQADSLIESNTDSALILLERISDIMTNGSRQQQARYGIMLTQALWKLDKPLPPDSLIEASFIQLSNTDDQHLRARSYYYRAVTIYDKGDHSRAMRLLKEGEQIASSIKDTLQMLKFEAHISWANECANNYPQMLTYAKKLLLHSIQAQKSEFTATALSHVSTAYAHLGQIDSSTIYIKQAFQLLDSSKKNYQATILANLGCNFYSNGDVENALKYLQMSIAVEPHGNAYSQIGNIYANRNDFSKAYEYWNKALEIGETRGRRITYGGMAVKLSQRGHYKEAFDALEKYSDLSDSIFKSNQSAELVEIQKKYDYQVVVNQYYRRWITGIIIAIVIIVALVLSVSFYKRRASRYQQTLNDMLVKGIEDEDKIHQLEKLGVSNSQEINKLKERIEIKQKDIMNHVGQGHDIYNRLKNQTDTVLNTIEEERMLIDYFIVMHNETYRQWTDLYGGLNRRPLVYMILNGIGKTDQEICNILRVSGNAIRTLKSRMQIKKPQE